MKITIIGAGTAGLVAAVVIKSKLPSYSVNVIESKKIGIIGVGEGSTEHWKVFCNECNIDINELIKETDATHKYGIRFENWSNNNPDYFHSISYYEIINGTIPIYDYINYNNKLLTSTLTHPAFIENKVLDTENPHLNTNQYHFDTFKLNTYLHKVAKEKGVIFFEDEILNINLNETTGYIESVESLNNKYEADFWIDSSGFARILAKKMGFDKWKSYSEYLLTDKAIPFPTESEPSGQIKPYTRARAMESGWIWEIPTQKRRGNGYVYSSNHSSVDRSIEIIYKNTGIQIDEPRVIDFTPGYMPTQWYKNCVVIGLSSSFMEPLEATSISTTIQQSRLLASLISGYKKEDQTSQVSYNKIMHTFHENLLSMISLHYVSDRYDTEFWKDCKNLKKPELLENMLEVLKYRTLNINDIPTSNYDLFGIAHFWHVIQGQNLISKEVSYENLSSQNLYQKMGDILEGHRINLLERKHKFHHELFQ